MLQVAPTAVVFARSRTSEDTSTCARNGPSECPLHVRRRPTFGWAIRGYEASVKCLRQHGHSPSNPLIIAEKADGWGIVMMALYASGPRWA